MSDKWSEYGAKALADGDELTVAGGFHDGKEVIRVRQGSIEAVPSLESDHEEADTRLLLHAKDASALYERIVVQSCDTDVAMLCVSHFKDLGCKELWFRTCVKDEVRFLPIHLIAQNLGTTLCAALPAYHALTGCDTTSSLSGVGKKRSWEILRKSSAHQESLSEFGTSLLLEENVLMGSELYICNQYTNIAKAGKTADEVRHWLFCKKNTKSDGLPPTSHSLLQHLKRANYQAFIWRKALSPIQHLSSPLNHGWELKMDGLVPTMMTKDTAPSTLLELISCHCKKTSCRRAACLCRVNGLPCTEACTFSSDECENPNNQMEVSDSSDDETDDI